MKLHKVKTTAQIRAATEKILNHYHFVLPQDRKAKVFLKINANSDMIGLTGNTTDLRLVVAVIVSLKKRGYGNIFLGDGTSSGFINSRINTLKRLGVMELVKTFNIGVVDLNAVEGKTISVLHGHKLKIAKICLDSDLFIDLPKLKTHGEVQMSCCLKSKIGCVVGLDKQIVHRDLAGNILELNRFVKPHLHIVDAILPMEGLGPSRGVPKNVGVLLADTNPLLLDLAACEIMGRSCQEIPYLALAERMGLITSKMEREAKRALADLKIFPFSYPNPNSFQKLINHPLYRHFFVKIRYAPALFELFSSSFIAKPMYLLGLRQDFFVKASAKIDSLKVLSQRALDSSRLDNYCPMALNVGKQLNSSRCIKCLYCYFVDRENAITIDGKINHLEYQVNKYKTLIEGIAP